jgi:hypothetical protein
VRGNPTRALRPRLGHLQIDDHATRQRAQLDGRALAGSRDELNVEIADQLHRSSANSLRRSQR